MQKNNTSLLSYFNSDNMAMTEILKINEETRKYGLVLSQKEAAELIESRNETLNNLGRVEIGAGIINKLIEKFCDSPYLLQEDYTSTLFELIEIFYYIKNESLDKISDDELIDLMKEYYDNTCRGSIELLLGRELETVARNVRFGIPDYTNMAEDEEINEDEGDGNE